MFIIIIAINSVAQGNAGGMIMTNSNLGGLGGGGMTGGGLVINNMKQTALPPNQLMGGMVNQGQGPNMHHPGHPGGMLNGPMMNPNRVAQPTHMGPRVPGPHIMNAPRMQPPKMQIGTYINKN